MRSLSTEEGRANAFRSDPKRTEALMQESMDQLQGNKNSQLLWLLYDDEGMKSGNWGAWNKMALWDDAKNWSGGLDDYRQTTKGKNAH